MRNLHQCYIAAEQTSNYWVNCNLCYLLGALKNILLIIRRLKPIIMKDLIFKNWNVIRFVRLGIGLFILVQAIIAADILFGVAGVLFAGMAIFNAGCSSGACSVPLRSKDVSVSKSYGCKPKCIIHLLVSLAYDSPYRPLPALC